MYINKLLVACIVGTISFNTLAQDAGPTRSEKFLTFREALQTRHIELTKPSLVAALHNPDAQIRYLAALMLAEDKATDAVPEIVNALKSEKDPETKTNIALALAQLGEQKGFTTLRSTCDSQDVPDHLRLYAAKYMLDIGNEYCLSTVLNILQSKSSAGVRALALSLLPRFEELSKANSQQIIAATVGVLADPLPDVRIDASQTLLRLAAVTAIPALEDAITKETEDTVRSRMQIDLQRLKEMQQKKQPSD